MNEKKVFTTCQICECACGLEVTVENNKVVKIAPDKEHPYSWRDFCIKGGKADEVMYHPRRLTSPMKRVGDRYVATSYEEAIGDIGDHIRKLIDQHGPDSVAYYGGNPSLFSWMSNVMATAFHSGLGSKNVYDCGSIDQNAHYPTGAAVYGCPNMSMIPDVDEAECVLLIGTNPAVTGMTWFGNQPDGWKRILRAQQRGADLIIVDPAVTPSARKATTHVMPKPGQDWAFLVAVIKTIFDKGWEDHAACAEVTGLAEVKAMIQSASIEDMASRCDVALSAIQDVAKRFAQARTGFCSARTGVSISENGSLGLWLAELLNIVTGRIDVKGGKVFSAGLGETGAWDALKALYEAPRIPSRVRKIPTLMGMRSISELADEINTPGDGQIRALLINAGNPVVMAPNGRVLDAALSTLELLVSVDMFQRESHRHAHWLIPGQHFLERSEFTNFLLTLNEQPYAQFSRKAVDAPEGVRPEWQFWVDVALRANIPLFGNSELNTVIAATRKLAQESGDPEQAWHPLWMEKEIVNKSGLFTWDELVNSQRGFYVGQKKYGSLKEHIRTDDKRIHAASPELIALLSNKLAQAPKPTGQFPLQLISRRKAGMMNSWLADTAGVVGWDRDGELIDINRQDADDLGISDGQKVRVQSPVSSLVATARVGDKVRKGVAIMDHGWGSRLFDPVNNTQPVVSGINRNELVSRSALDPLAGAPNLNGQEIRISVA